jgi:hypothetical protein
MTVRGPRWLHPYSRAAPGDRPKRSSGLPWASERNKAASVGHRPQAGNAGWHAAVKRHEVRSGDHGQRNEQQGKVRPAWARGRRPRHHRDRGDSSPISTAWSGGSQINTRPAVSLVNASRLPSRAEPRASFGVGSPWLLPRDLSVTKIWRHHSHLDRPQFDQRQCLAHSLTINLSRCLRPDEGGEKSCTNWRSSVPELASCKAESAVAAAAAGDFGLTANDMQALAQKLHPNESAIVILFENVWERRFRDAAKARGGEVLNQRLISSKGLVEAAVRLARE